jgi:hypothetical protein
MSESRKKVVKSVKYATLYADGTIKIEGVRASYPHLDKPYSGRARAGGDQGTPAYSITGLLDKTTHKDAKNLIRDFMNDMMKEHKVKDIAADKKFLRDGDLSGKTENEGMFTVSAREQNPPILRDEKNRSVERADAARKFYGGCYVDILIRPWWQDNAYGKRINANLLAVKFVKDGDAFGEGRITDDDVDDVFGSADDDDDSGYVEDDDEEGI